MFTFPFSVFAAFASADPILPDGGLSSNWALIVLAGVAAFFLVRTLNRLEADIKSLALQVSDLNSGQIEMKTNLDNIKNEVDSDKIAEITIAKLLAMQGGSGGRHWPFGQKDSE